MANSLTFKDQNIRIGDSVSVTYKLKEGEKERQQTFQGILIKVRGSSEKNRMITVRKVSKAGIGVERIFPLFSQNLLDIKRSKETSYRRAKLYFIRNLSERETRHKIYQKK